MLNENDKKSRQQKQNPSMNTVGTMRIQEQTSFLSLASFISHCLQFLKFIIWTNCFNDSGYNLELKECLILENCEMYFVYRTRAIITRGLYILYLIFYCGLYSREVNVADSLCNNKR